MKFNSHNKNAFNGASMDTFNSDISHLNQQKTPTKMSV